ncbi:MAG: hypothetical protein NVV74_25530 [Magnetospirillum sp.]|nr:hypothetical protein [Magnetospirillum sp.]
MAAGQTEAVASLRLPPELRNRLVRLDIEAEQGPARWCCWTNAGAAARLGWPVATRPAPRCWPS